MAKCQHCGKSGFFLKINLDGVCPDCVRIKSLENEAAQLDFRLTKLNKDLSDKESLYETIAAKAKVEALSAAESELNALEQKQKEYLDKNASLAEEISRLESDGKTLTKKVVATESRLIKLNDAWERSKHAAKLSETPIELPFETLQLLTPTIEIKLQCLNIKELRKQFNDNKKEIAALCEKYCARYETKTIASLYALMTLALESELQNVLYNISFGKLENSIDAIKAMTQKYMQICLDGNQTIAPTIKRFIGEIEFLFLRAVELEYEYYVQKERAKEQQRAIREQMRQDAEERKELERQNKQLEKEQSKYYSEVENLKAQLKTESDPAKESLLLDRIAELESQLNQVAAKCELITTLQNGKAGYVYVISNLGSFGCDVFKIGMTRRLEPQERVNELGSASVPFPFDVHSFIFSNDAVSLEHELHIALNNKRLNKVNVRKEFFKVTIDELETLVYKTQPTAEFNQTLLAQQYYQSLSIETVPDEDELNDTTGIDELE
ncbi:hypothetical protein FACS189425_05540 [Clostridia bacterium]|nr:hypothetical protein FACS189425_05540 [Clostridia bacterium]